MRLLFTCWLDPATTDAPLFLIQGVEAAGHQVYLFPPDLEFSNRAAASLRDMLALHDPDLNRTIMEERLDARCRSFQPDVLLFSHPFVTPKGMDRLRRRHNCLLGYYIGYNNLLEGLLLDCVRLADFVVIHDTYLLPLLQGTRYQRKQDVLLILCYATPEEHRPLTLNEQDRQVYGCDVAFIGGCGPNRVHSLQRLAQYQLRIWGGKDWARTPLASFFSAEPVYGLKKTKIYNAAKIILNIEDDEKQVNAVSNRVPEVLACGGFVLTDWRKDLERLGLVDGESIAIYRTHDELSEKVSYYLAHPEERQRITANGRRIVLDTLTNVHAGAAFAAQLENLLRRHKRDRR